MTKKMTPWFPSNIKPVRAGLYEADTPICPANRYAYFDGKDWGLCAADVNAAMGEKFWPFASEMLHSQSKWRGFAEKQA